MNMFPYASERRLPTGDPCTVKSHIRIEDVFESGRSRYYQLSWFLSSQFPQYKKICSLIKNVPTFFVLIFRFAFNGIRRPRRAECRRKKPNSFSRWEIFHSMPVLNSILHNLMHCSEFPSKVSPAQVARDSEELTKAKKEMEKRMHISGRS